MNGSMKIRTSLSKQLIKSQLITGFGLGLLGVLGLLFAGIFLPVLTLQKWGWLIFLLGLGLITVGLLPYRRLIRLENKPNELIVTDDDKLEFWARGECRLAIPIKSIKRLEFVENKNDYGIAVWIEQGSNIEGLRGRLRQYFVSTNGGGEPDFVFRYFTKRSYEELRDYVA